MAHFLTIVIVERTPPRPQERVRQLLRPYFHPDPDPDSRLYHQYKCDGWVIGGRFDGLIFDKEQHYNLGPSEYQKRYGLDVVKPADNIRPVSELPEGLLLEVYAVVTPKGEWHDCSEQTSDEWATGLRSLLAHYPDLVGRCSRLSLLNILAESMQINAMHGARLVRSRFDSASPEEVPTILRRESG